MGLFRGSLASQTHVFLEAGRAEQSKKQKQNDSAE
jgi:hypothetical protein